MIENHSYDNRLGMLNRPGADGFHLRHGLPTATNPYANGDLQHAFRMPATCQLNGKPAQDWLDSHLQFNHGRNDGFVKSGSGPVAMGYWQQADQPFYYSLARAFPIADRYFCSMPGQTFPNRCYLISATSIGQMNDTLPNQSDYPANGTIFDTLDAAGITWRDYCTTLPTTPLCPRLFPKNHGTRVIPVAWFFTARRRLLRRRAAATGHPARRHPAGRARGAVCLQRLCPVRLPGSVRCHLAVGKGGLCLAPDL